MAGEDVIVSIGIDASAANAGLAQTQAKFTAWGNTTERSLVKVETAATKTTKAVAKVTRPVDEAAASVAKLKAGSEDLEKVASFLGPNIGGLVSQMSKFGKVTGAGIGGATLAIAGLTAGIGAGLYVMSSYAAMVADTVENVDDLAASLDVVTRERLAAQITSLRNSRAALDDAADGWTELKIVLADVADGPMTDVATLAGALAKGWALAGEKAKSAGVDFRNSIPYVGSLLVDLERIAKLTRMYDEWKSGKPATGGGSVAPGTGPLMPAKPITAADLTFDFAASAPTAQPATSSNRAAPSGGVDAIQSSMFLAGITIPKSQIDLRAAGLAAITDLDQKYADQKAALDKQIADEAIAQIERETAARQAAVQTAIGIAGQLTSALAAFSDAEAQAKIDGAEKGTLAYYYAVQDQFNTAQAFALGMAAMNIALGFTQELATKGVVGLATGIALAAAGAIEVGTILAQRPPEMRHTGGTMAGDEYVVRASEVPAMLTAEGAKNRQGLADLNAGTASKNAEPVIYLVNESGMQRARQHTKPRPDLGLRMVGAR